MPDCWRCGSGTLHPLTEHCQPGDIQVRSLYNPARQTGRITGRQYPRTLGVGQLLCVAPSDVQAAPDLWQLTALPESNIVMNEAGLL